MRAFEPLRLIVYLAQFVAPSPAAQGVREILAHFGVV